MSDTFITGESSKITGLSLYCNETHYAVRALRAQLGLGAVANCHLDVICAIPESRLSGSASELETLDVDGDYAELVGAFPYGSYAKVFMCYDGEQVQIFDGYVASAGGTLASSISTFGYSCSVILQSAAAMYGSHGLHPSAAYITVGSSSGDTFTGLQAAIVPSVKKTEEDKTLEHLSGAAPFNPALFAATYIDHLASIARTHAGGYSDSNKDYDKLANFINVGAAPTLNVSVNVASDWLTDATKRLSTISAADITRQLQRAPGLAVFNNYIGQFGLILAPRVNLGGSSSGISPLEVIPDIGIKDEDCFIVSPYEILGYQLQYPTRELGEYHAIAVMKNPNQLRGEIRVKSETKLWLGGYTDSGEPVLLSGIDYSPTPNGKNSNIVSKLGPVTVIPLPAWLTSISSRGAEGNSLTSVWEAFADALAKTYYGKGLIATGRLTVRVLFQSLHQYVNCIGKEGQIDLSSTNGDSGTYVAARYGRLIGVNYSIETGAADFRASLSLDFDCVCTEDEYDTFKVDAKGMLCSS